MRSQDTRLSKAQRAARNSLQRSRSRSAVRSRTPFAVRTFGLLCPGERKGRNTTLASNGIRVPLNSSYFWLLTESRRGTPHGSVPSMTERACRERPIPQRQAALVKQTACAMNHQLNVPLDPAVRLRPIRGAREMKHQLCCMPHSSTREHCR